MSAIGARDGTVDSDTVLPASRLHVRFPMVSEFFIDRILRLHCGPEIDSAANSNEYQEYFLGCKGGWYIGLTTLPPSHASRPEIWELQPPGTPWASNRPVYSFLYLYL